MFYFRVVVVSYFDGRRAQKTLAPLHVWIVDDVLDALRFFRFVQKTKGETKLCEHWHHSFWEYTDTTVTQSIERYTTHQSCARRVSNKLHVVCGAVYGSALYSPGWNVTSIPLLDSDVPLIYSRTPTLRSL